MIIQAVSDWMGRRFVRVMSFLLSFAVLIALDGYDITYKRFRRLAIGYRQNIFDGFLCGSRFQVSVFRFQVVSIRFPDTRNLTPDTYSRFKNRFFCCSAGVTRRRWTALGPKRIIDELGPLTTRNRVDVVGFCDANFFVNRKRVLELCKAKQDRGLEFLWQASMDPDTAARMSGAELTSISASGCFSLFVGYRI